MTHSIIFISGAGLSNSVFYTLLHDPHDKSSYLLPPYRVITMWLTVFPILYITSLGLDSLLLHLASIQKHHCHSQCQRAYGLCFLLGVLSFQAIQRIHFCVRKWSSLILLHVAVQFLQQHLLNRPSFPCHVPLPPMT